MLCDAVLSSENIQKATQPLDVIGVKILDLFLNVTGEYDSDKELK